MPKVNLYLILNQYRNVADTSLDIGEPTESAYLVGGLDPSCYSYQVAFLWAIYDTETIKMQMIDLENNKGGGIKEALRIIKE